MKQHLFSKCISAGALAASAALCISSIITSNSVFIPLTYYGVSLVFLYCYKNPSLLESTSWEQFGEEYDKSDFKSLLWGNEFSVIGFLLIVLISVIF